MSSPFSRNGQLSAAALRQIAAEAAGARRHIVGGDANGYIASGGAVMIPAPQTAIDYFSVAISPYNLTPDWSDITTASQVLPAGSTWLLLAQLTAAITFSVSGDFLACRYFDGTAQVGQVVEFADAICDDLTLLDAAPLMAIYTVGASAVTMVIQGKVNTGSSSQGIIQDSQMVGMRLA